MGESPFLGSAYSLRSKNLADQQAVNIYMEVVEEKVGKGAEPGGFYGTPGLTLLNTLGSGPIRGMRTYNGALYVVSGANVYRVTGASLASASLIGQLRTSTGMVRLLDNGTGAGGAPGGQLGIFDGTAVYVWQGNAFNASIALPVTGPFAPPVEQDTFVLMPQAGTQIVWQCNSSDMTTWPANAFNTEDGSGDNIVALGELHRQVYVFLNNHVAFWVNAGTSPFAFQRLDGPYMEAGCIAPQSIAKCGERLVWLSNNRQGQGIVVGTAEYAPERLSNYAIENHFLSFPTLTDAVAWSYQQGGHVFYVISFPTAGETWALDLTVTSQVGYPCWHRRAYLQNGLLTQHRAVCQANFGTMTVVGDYATGAIYKLDPSNFTDNGQPIKRLRTWRALPRATSKAMAFKVMEVMMETGISTPQGQTPQLMLRYSDDGGHSYGAQTFLAGGQVGQTAQALRFWRLGSTRRGMASDRSFELSMTDNAKCAWLDATVNDGV